MGLRGALPAPTHHDHGHHDGRNADEVQLPREEVVDLLVAVRLWGTASGRSGVPVLGAPAVGQPRVIAERA